MRFAPIVIAAIALAACGGSNDATSPTTTPPGGTTGSTTNSIAVGDNTFTPTATTVTKGTTVTWNWGGARPHNVTFDDGTKSVNQTAGTYSRTFDVAGSYPYHCTIHGVAMSGTITVK